MPVPGFDSHADFARALDEADELAEFAAEFERPRQSDGTPARYFCGHSLGLLPRGARTRVSRELERWSQRAVEGHFDGDGWFSFHERFATPLAGLLGADATEVVAMNSLTVNLHLMMVSFFEPESGRCRILIERGAFPSDRFAVQSQLAWHGLDPVRDLVELDSTRTGGITSAGLDAALSAESGRVALVLLPGVQYLTGEAINLAACAEVARRHGCRIGFDLAHAIGNLALELRDSEPDFAVWCGYKYLNGGPGAIGGCFVNRRWIEDRHLQRFAGWWGHDKSSRFGPARQFQPMPTAEAWQISNPPVLAMAPLEASLELFTATGIGRLRAKSVALTAYLDSLVEYLCGAALELISPHESHARGAQLSYRIRSGADRGARLAATLRDAGTFVDWRAPDVLRLAPVPLYNSFAEIHAGVSALAAALES